MSLVLIAALAIAFYASTMTVLILNIRPPLKAQVTTQNKTPTIYITLYAGEISESQLGFGLSPNNLTSPGPTVKLKITDVVSLTFMNAGKMPHALAVTSVPKTSSAVLFNAQIGSAANPIEPGKSGTVVFAPDNAGTFYYICPIPGHAELGMYGAVVITG